MYSQNLKKIREKLDLSVAKFAKKLEMPPSTITQYERGTRTPSWALFVQLNTKINVNLNWFTTGKGAMFNSQEDDDFDTRVTSIVKRILNEEHLKKAIR